MNTKNQSAIVQFYCGRGTTTSGKTFTQIMKFTDEEMEGVHDYIQWIFPTSTVSHFNPYAPVLTKEDVKFMMENVVFQKRFLRAIKKILKFWGFKFKVAAFPTGFIKVCNRDIKINSLGKDRHWFRRGNHNLMRLTRFIECMRIFTKNEVADSMYLQLRELALRMEGDFITGRNILFWADATAVISPYVSDEIPF